jgi:hypothetical protein
MGAFSNPTIVDAYARESPVIKIGQNLKGEDVAHALGRLPLEPDAPKVLLCDYGV